MRSREGGKRNLAVDCVRCIALYSVISVHFFKNIGYYSGVIKGKAIYFMTVLRTALMVCVPLFCILSGYLLCNKVYHKGYYKGLGKTLVTYILACGANLIWRTIFLQESITLRQGLLGILNFTAAPYGWYIEMYIGLFLIAPFLNGAYHFLPDKRSKQGLIFTVLVLTALPSIVNIYNFDTAGWWSNPAISNSYVKLIPAWWTGIWPVSYYLLGMYLNEYGLKIKSINNFLIYGASVLLFGTFNFYRSYGNTFIWGAWQDWGALPNIIMTVLLFNLLLKIKIQATFAAHFLAKLSSLCLGGYLVSYIFDTAFYPYLNRNVSWMPYRIFYYPIMTVSVYICSLLLSFVLQLLQQFIKNMWNCRNSGIE